MNHIIQIDQGASINLESSSHLCMPSVHCYTSLEVVICFPMLWNGWFTNQAKASLGNFGEIEENGYWILIILTEDHRGSMNVTKDPMKV